MLKKLILLLIILSLNNLNAEKISVLREILKPEQIIIANNKYFITQESSVYIYSIKDNKLVKKFGRKGEGPGEFKSIPSIRIIGDKIFTHASNKIGWFTFNGKMIREKILSTAILRITPVKEKFLILKWEFPTKFHVVLLDKDLKEIRKIHTITIPDPNKKIKMAKSPLKFYIWNNKIFISAGSKEFIIKVFNVNEGELSLIKKPYKKIRMADWYTKMQIEEFKRDKVWGILKTRIEFPKFFPPIYDFFMDNGNMYVRTYKRDGDNIEFIILKDNGDEVRRIFLPFKDVYTFNKGDYFFLAINEDDEYELHRIKL